MNNNETIANWLGWHKFSDRIWCIRDLQDGEDYSDDILQGGPLDFQNNLHEHEFIKARLCSLSASIKLVHRMNRRQAWRLVVELRGAPRFDQQARGEGELWYKAALYFAGLEK